MLEKLMKQLDEYKKDWQKTAENRDRMMQMLNQHEAKLHQLSGAISALERVIQESEKEQMTDESAKEELPDEQVNDIPKSAKS